MNFWIIYTGAICAIAGLITGYALGYGAHAIKVARRNLDDKRED